MHDLRRRPTSYYGFSPGVVTGKPLEFFGSPGRTEATGCGLLHVLDEALAETGRSLSHVTVALQGFGNVGSHAARLIAERGGKIVAVGDRLGGGARSDGLDVPRLIEWAREYKTVNGFPDAESIASVEVLTWDADVLIPAALENALTEENAGKVRARIVSRARTGQPAPERTRSCEKTVS